MITGVGTLGICYRVKRNDRFYFKDGNIIWLKNFLNNVDSQFVEHLYKSDFIKEQIAAGANGGTVGTYTITNAKNTTIPLPPLEIQEQIVAELDGYQNIIQGAQQIVKNWKPTIDINPEWEIKPLGEIADIEYGFTDTAKECGEARFIRITDIDEFGELRETDKKFIDLTTESEKYLLKKGDLLVARTGATFGKTLFFMDEEKAVFASYLIRINFDKDVIIPSYYWVFSRSITYWKQAQILVTGGGQPQFNGNALKNIIIPLPSLEIQQQIVEKIEAERTLVESTKKLIQIYEQKTKTTLDKLWKH
jgi:restriction endonuclease S subunit